MASLTSKQAYLKRLRDERGKIHVIPVSKRTAWQRSRMRDLQAAIKIVAVEINNLQNPSPSPVEGVITPEQIKALTESFKKMGFTQSSVLATMATKYQQAYQSYVQNKPYYASNWQKIYGADLPEFGFADNPFAMAATVGSGKFKGYDLAQLAIQANTLEQNIGEFEKLNMGDWENLGYSQLQELSKTYGSDLPSQAELAQLKTGTMSEVGGASWGTWQQRYEDFRQARKSGFQSSKTTFAAPQKKPALTADFEY